MEKFDYIKLAVNTVMVLLIILVAIILLQTLFYSQKQAMIYSRDISQVATEAKDIYANQKASIEKYHWIDKDKKIVAIPIERAMDKIVEEANKQ